MGVQNNGRPENTIDGTPLLKMKELVDETGISKATILYYINEGLLPKPVKTNPNVAYYPASFVERLRFIRQLKTKHRLSLAQIKQIIKEREKGREVSPLIELNDVIFGQKESSFINKTELLKATGLKSNQLTTALKMKLINPKKKQCYDSEDVAMGCHLKRCLDLGITFETLGFYPSLAEQFVKYEMQVRNSAISDKSFEELISITMELTAIARSFRGYVIDRIFQNCVETQGLKGSSCN